MANKTGISWATATWPITSGCAKQGPECENCYAIKDTWRMAHNPNPKVSDPFVGLVSKTTDGLNWTGDVRELPSRLSWPQRWNNETIFVSSLSDIFHPKITFKFLAEVFKVIYLDTRNTYLILTKLPQQLSKFLRSQELREVLGGSWGIEIDPLPHIRFGASVGCLKSLWRVKELVQIPAAYRFLSMEPLLEDVPIPPEYIPGLSQVIVGGESASREKCRAMNVDWALGLRDTCLSNRLPFWFKQRGNWDWDYRDVSPINRRQFFDRDYYFVARMVSGNLLDGTLWEQPMRLV